MADEEKPETPEGSPDTEPSNAGQQAGQQADGELTELAGAEEPTAQEPAEPTPQEQEDQERDVGSREAAEVAAVAADAPVEAQQVPEEAAPEASEGDAEEEPAARVKPSVPGAHLEVDIVPEGVDPLGSGESYEDPYAIEGDEAGPEEEGEEDEEDELAAPIATAAIDLASGARYRATGKRKTAIARVTLRPGSGAYLVNGRSLEQHFPRATLQRNIRQPLETVGYEERMDVVARLHGGGISAQAGALRHGVSRALLEADPNLRGELKRRGFLTRDSRAKERKKAGLKKARKRPQFSKR